MGIGVGARVVVSMGTRRGVLQGPVGVRAVGSDEELVDDVLLYV